MRTVRLWTQSAGVIRPAQLYQRDLSSRNAPGLSGFKAWCYKCNKPVQVIQKVHEGSGGAAWLAKCHRHGAKCDPHSCKVQEHEHAIEIERLSTLLEMHRVDDRANLLVYFAPDGWYEAAKTSWTEGATG